MGTVSNTLATSTVHKFTIEHKCVYQFNRENNLYIIRIELFIITWDLSVSNK